MTQPAEVKALPGYRLWVRYTDGVAGTVDLSGFAGKGVFAVWDAPGAWERVYVADGGGIAWSDEVEICPDAVYLQLSGGRLPHEFGAGATVAAGA